VTTLQDVRLECPVCKRTFNSKAVVYTNSFGGKRTDFHERASGEQPLSYLLHSCRQCGYTGEEKDFSDEVDLWPELKELVFYELRPLLDYEGETGAAKYEAAAKIAEWKGVETRHIADLYLRAAWCCVNDGDTEAERYYRRLAANKFEIALSCCDGIDFNERAVITYLIGELWRRIGNKVSASYWFNKVESEIVDWETQEWVVEAARQQNGEEPREWFG
jgi:uncharacterized protein